MSSMVTTNSNSEFRGTTETPGVLPPSAMPLVSPQALLQAHLQQNPPTRPSNRSPSTPRQIEVNIGSLTQCHGSSVVKIGSSSVVCGIRAEILPVTAIPHYRAEKSVAGQGSRSWEAQETNGNDFQEDEEDEGNYEEVRLNNLLVPNLELGTGCHPLFPANTAPSTTAQSISQRILSLLHSSKLVRTTDLEIRYTSSSEGREVGNTGLDPDDPAYVPEEPDQLKAYWVLYIDMVCISYGGSVFDTAWLAVLAALSDVLLPRAWWERDLGQVYCSAKIEEGRKLRLRGMPVPISFGAFVVKSQSVQQQQQQQKGIKSKDRTEILLDTDVFEEEVCDETGCVTVDCSRNQCTISRMEKSGGEAIGVNEVRDIIVPAAEKRWKEWQGVLEKAIEGSNG